MKRVLFTVSIVLLLALPATAGPQIVATALWTPGQTQARVGLMDGALEAGLFGAYTKDRAGDDREFTAGGLYGLLHILQIEDGPFGQPISGYLGGFGGPMEEGDGVFGAISGVAIGPLVLEYQYQPDTSLATVDNEHLAFVGLRCAFK